MKIRLDFVTNSSSSSYICDISGRVESGWDLPLEDAQMYECTNGHIFSDQFLVKDFSDVTFDELHKAMIERIAADKERLKNYPGRDYLIKNLETSERQIEEVVANKKDTQWLNEFANDVLEWNSRYGVNPAYCPICTLTNLSDSDCLRFFIKAQKMNKEAVLQEIRKDFGSYESFLEFLNK